MTFNNSSATFAPTGSGYATVIGVCRGGVLAVVVGIAGGSGSGKTTLVEAIVAGMAPQAVVRLEQDSYYRERPELSFAERETINYDHPDALDNGLLVEHVSALVQGSAVDKPVCDFALHQRTMQRKRIEPAPVVLVDGILVLESAALRALLDLKLFVDTDPDVRVLRRIERDLRERERTLDSVVAQYMETVRPMHLQFVEPSKRYADVIIPEGGLNAAAAGMVIARLHALLTI
ncbi:MAG: uridine kinase [Chloroflexia bacterium]|nr:uridine kinase [Chloroflexia bacterium]